MIILHQNDGVVLAFHFFEHRAGEFAVDLLIGLPIFDAEDGAGVGDVAERPDAFVRESVVVAFFFLASQPDAAQRVLGLGGRDAQAVMLVDRFMIGVASAVG